MWKKAGRCSEYADGIPTELRQHFSDFVVIGSGTYGTVYRVTPRSPGPQAALKKIKLSTSERLVSMSLPATAVREILILRELRHPAIVTLRDVFFKAAGLSLWLWFDYCPLDLRVLVRNINRAYIQIGRGAAPGPLGLPLDIARRFTQQLFSGMASVHRLNILHRDLKPQNILMNDTVAPPGAPPILPPDLVKALLAMPDVGPKCLRVLEHAYSTTAQIADFGLSRTNKVQFQALTHEVITLWYRPPEILLGCEVYTSAVDVWSLGCIVAEMVIGRSLFPGDSEIDTLFRIFRLLGTPESPQELGFEKLTNFHPAFPRWYVRDSNKAIGELIFPGEGPGFDPQLVDFVAQCLQLNPEKRLTCAEALMHPYLKS